MTRMRRGSLLMAERTLACRQKRDRVVPHDDA